MRILILLVLVLGTLFPNTLTDEEQINKYVLDLKNLGQDQLDIVNQIVKYEPEKGLVLELLTIAWKESNFGRWPVNITDGKYGSFGIYHIRLDYALTRNKITSSWGKSRYVEKLLYDFEVSSAECVSLLIYWDRYYKKSKKGEDLLKHIFASYNGGYKLSQQALTYGKDALLRYKALKRMLESK